MTIKDLESRIDRRFSDMQHQFTELRSEVRSELGEMTEKVEKFNNYMQYESGFKAGSANVKTKDIKMPKQIWGLIVKLVAIIGTLLLLLQAAT